ncbi:hypothetical protein WME79_17110 [Sorangium sp. So ce726]|uniref:hypothetical protein n=1 Tax=Sorangium sp. So ce726 TaxID=3133319 RepID=UPI003F6038B0
MADRGYRSIEVTVINNTRASLVVQGGSTAGANSTWIAGERPTTSSVMPQYSIVTWGVMTTDQDSAASASVTLTGLGHKPVQLRMENLASGESKVTPVGNDRIDVHCKQLNTGEDNHSQFELSFNPVEPRAC